MKSDDMGTVFKGVWKRTDGNQNVAIKTVCRPLLLHHTFTFHSYPLHQCYSYTLYSPSTEYSHMIVQIRTRGKDAIADIFHELQIMAGLNHSNICHVYGACLVSEKEVWLVLELADGNLHDFLSTTTLTYHQQLSFAIQIAQALNYIHSLPTPIIHRDITTTSILVQKKGKTLLSGFGLAQTFSLVTSQTETFGSPRWAAPEVLDTDKTWSEKSDIYSLGMVLYEIVSGKLPFDEEDWNMEKIMKKIKGGKRPKIPKQCPKVCSSCLYPPFSSLYSLVSFPCQLTIGVCEDHQAMLAREFKGAPISEGGGSPTARVSSQELIKPPHSRHGFTRGEEGHMAVCTIERPEKKKNNLSPPPLYLSVRC